MDELDAEILEEMNRFDPDNFKEADDADGE